MRQSGSALARAPAKFLTKPFLARRPHPQMAYSCAPDFSGAQCGALACESFGFGNRTPAGARRGMIRCAEKQCSARIFTGRRKAGRTSALRFPHPGRVRMGQSRATAPLAIDSADLIRMSAKGEEVCQVITRQGFSPPTYAARHTGPIPHWCSTLASAKHASDRY